MKCRITDEKVINPWDFEDDRIENKSLEDVTLEELMGEEYAVWVGANKKFGFIIEIENEKGEKITESRLHPCAAESFASFCRQYLAHYDRVKN